MKLSQIKLIGYACAAILLIGWFVAKHYATATARDMVQGYLIRNNLTRYVTYSDISASPFGTATMYDVKAEYGPDDRVSMKSLRISDVHFKDGQLTGFAIAGRGVNVPIVAFARNAAPDNPFREWLGMGYTSVSGDMALSFGYDSGRSELSASTTGNWTDAGSWRISIRLDNLDQSLVHDLSHPTSELVARTLSDPSALIASLARISLAQADLTIDDSSLQARDREVVDAEVPGPAGSDSRQKVEDPEIAGMRNDLVKAGMAPSAADRMTTTVASWYANGGKISFSTRLAQPLVLIASGSASPMDSGMPRPAFDSLASFIVATNAEVSQ